MRRGVKRSEAAVGVGEMAATACKERSVWKWRRQPTRACRRQQSFLDTFAAAAVLAVIIGIDDALEEIMIVQLARAHQISPSVKLRETNAQYPFAVVETIAVLDAYKPDQTR